MREGILILPHNEYRAILRVSSLNFELRSEEEQDAIIDTYESFLNSVGTNLQILVRTREIDMDKYLESLRERQVRSGGDLSYAATKLRCVYPFADKE